MNSFSKMSSGKRAFLTGTLLLTGTGFACRVLGFFYRIFLSRTIGAEGLGLYNMIHPVFGICFALCAGSMQTALSQYIAAHASQGKTVFRSGLFLSMTMASVLAFLISRHAGFLALHLLREPRCGPYLPLIALSVPFAALHACINGYYYGTQNAKIPAFSQLAEQMLRMTLVFLLASVLTGRGKPITVRLAVTGHLIGEMASAAFTVLCMYFAPPQRIGGRQPGAGAKTPVPVRQSAHSPATMSAQAGAETGSLGSVHAGAETGSHGSVRVVAKDGSPAPISNALRPHRFASAAPLLSLALPLMGNRLVLNLLAGAEAIWIPGCLKLAGLRASEAFSIYGVLTGMALPFVLFPSAVTNSMAVMLLPGVAEAQANGQKARISASIRMSLRYSLYMGILCIGIFTLFGNTLGSSVFHNAEAGHFIRVLAWLCPFLYLATTIGSILNGLGRTRVTFLHNTLALLARLGFVLIGIPRFGIMAYLWGMLASELLLSLLHLRSLRKQIPFTWNAWEMLLKPIALLLTSIGVFRFACSLPLPPGVQFLTGELPVFVCTAFQIIFICLLYGGLLLVFHFGKKR